MRMTMLLTLIYIAAGNSERRIARYNNNIAIIDRPVSSAVCTRLKIKQIRCILYSWVYDRRLKISIFVSKLVFKGRISRIFVPLFINLFCTSINYIDLQSPSAMPHTLVYKTVLTIFSDEVRSAPNDHHCEPLVLFFS